MTTVLIVESITSVNEADETRNGIHIGARTPIPEGVLPEDARRIYLQLYIPSTDPHVNTWKVGDKITLY